MAGESGQKIICDTSVNMYTIKRGTLWGCLLSKPLSVPYAVCFDILKELVDVLFDVRHPFCLQ